jgi:hypothetical protein
MEIQVYQLGPYSDRFGSALAFKAQGDTARSQPVCDRADVEKAIETTARRWRPSASER